MLQTAIFIFRLSKSTPPPAPRTSARTLHSVWTFDPLKVSASSSRLLTRSFQFQKETSSSILCDTWQTGSRRPDPPEMAQHLSSPIRCSSWRSCGQTPSLARMPTQTSYFTITKNCQSCWEVLNLDFINYFIINTGFIITQNFVIASKISLQWWSLSQIHSFCFHYFCRYIL